MSQALDYSAGFPGAYTIRDAGYAGAVRYIGFPDRRKCTTRGELADFTAAGIGMALVFEARADDWRGGYDQGRLSGVRGRGHATEIGFPTSRPIYMATDQDVVTASEFRTMTDYLRGAATTLGGVELTGVYGEADVIDVARSAGVATWFWQTAAWSKGRRTAAHLFQRVGTVNVGGIGCDINDILQPDWGQHNAGDHMPLTDADKPIITAALLDMFRSYISPYDGRNLADTIVQGAKWSGEAVGALAGLSDDESKILAAIAVGNGKVLEAVAAIPPGGQVSDEQVTRIVSELDSALLGQFDVTITRKAGTP